MAENDADIPFLDIEGNNYKNDKKLTKEEKHPPDGGFWASDSYILLSSSRMRVHTQKL